MKFFGVVKKLLEIFRTYDTVEQNTDLLFLMCRACGAKIVVHKNYGRLIYVCQNCKKQHSIQTGRFISRPELHVDHYIKQILVNKLLFKGEPDGKIRVSAEVENRCDWAIKDPLISFKFRNGTKEILLFPVLGNQKGSSVSDVLIPAKSKRVFCHYLTKDEAEEAARCGFGEYDVVFRMGDLARSQKIKTNLFQIC